MPNLFKMMFSMAKNNPKFANDQQAQNYLQIIGDAFESGDTKRAEEVAKNLCETYGVSPEEGVSQAQSFFSNMNYNNLQ